MEVDIKFSDLRKDQKAIIRDEYFKAIMKGIESCRFSELVKEEVLSTVPEITDWILGELYVGESQGVIEKRIENAIKKEFNK